MSADFNKKLRFKFVEYYYNTFCLITFSASDVYISLSWYSSDKIKEKCFTLGIFS
jgi:predicted FMN-binding regulatory protein PaiB